MEVPEMKATSWPILCTHNQILVAQISTEELTYLMPTEVGNSDIPRKTFSQRVGFVFCETALFPTGFVFLVSSMIYSVWSHSTGVSVTSNPAVLVDRSRYDSILLRSTCQVSTAGPTAVVPEIDDVVLIITIVISASSSSTLKLITMRVMLLVVFR